MGFASDVLDLLKEITPQVNGIVSLLYRPYGLTFVQAEVLLELAESDGMKITELSERLEMGKSNLSPLCRRLEERGFLVRHQDQVDRRIIHLYLTDKSKEMIKRMQNAALSEQEESLGLTQEEQTVLMQTLRLLKKRTAGILHQNREENVL